MCHEQPSSFGARRWHETAAESSKLHRHKAQRYERCSDISTGLWTVGTFLPRMSPPTGHQRNLVSKTAWLWATWSLLALVTLGSIFFIWLQGGQHGLEHASWLGGILAALLALLTLPPTWMDLVRKGSPPKTTSTTGQIARASQELSDQILAQWSLEMANLELQTPLSIHWKPSPSDIRDHTRRAGLIKSGETTRIADLVTTFLGLPQRRLIILGSAGSGKTTLAILFTIQLSEQRTPETPVPIYLPAGSWNPQREHLNDWLERSLSEQYPFLRQKRFGSNVAHGLVMHRRVLPVIDGLDEIPDDLRVDALRIINRSLNNRDPIVVTCRSEQYRHAVQEYGVIKGAAVIEALPVRPADATRFLREVVEPGRLPRWQHVLRELRLQRRGPLALTLTTPLMLSMVRLIYATGTKDPSELLDRDRLPSQSAIEGHVLKSVIPELIDQAGDLPDDQRYWRWDDKRSLRWLTFLAKHLYLKRTTDIAWWDLHRSTPVLLRWLSIFGFIVGFVPWIAIGLAFRATALLAVAAGIGLRVGLVLGLALRTWLYQSVQEADVTNIGGTSLRLVRAIRAIAAPIMALVAAVTTMMAVVGPLAGLAFVSGVACAWLGLRCLDWRRLAPSQPVDWQTSLREHRSQTLVRELVLGVGGLLVVWVGGVLAVRLLGLHTDWHAVSLTVAFGFGASLTDARAAHLGFSLQPLDRWMQFMAARWWLATRGRLPWRLTEFLEDSYRARILRRLGGVFQFRHSRLQDHLSASPLYSPSDLEHNPVPSPLDATWQYPFRPPSP